MSEREFLLVLNAVDIVRKRTQSQAAALSRILIALMKIKKII